MLKAKKGRFKDVNFLRTSYLIVLFPNEIMTVFFVYEIDRFIEQKVRLCIILMDEKIFLSVVSLFPLIVAFNA